MALGIPGVRNKIPPAGPRTGPAWGGVSCGPESVPGTGTGQEHGGYLPRFDATG